MEELGYLGDKGNTIVIFSSDNGGPVPEGGAGATGTCNWPLRGGKDTGSFFNIYICTNDSFCIVLYHKKNKFGKAEQE